MCTIARNVQQANHIRSNRYPNDSFVPYLLHVVIATITNVRVHSRWHSNLNREADPLVFIVKRTWNCIGFLTVFATVLRIRFNRQCENGAGPSCHVSLTVLKFLCKISTMHTICLVSCVQTVAYIFIISSTSLLFCCEYGKYSIRLYLCLVCSLGKFFFKCHN